MTLSSFNPTRAESPGDPLRAKALALVEEAKAIAETAERDGREFTTTERETVKAKLDEARSLKAQADTADGDANVRWQVDHLGESLDGNPFGARSGFGWNKAAMPHRDHAWGRALTSYLDQLGAKALVPSGTITVPSSPVGITTGVDRPRSVLAMIPTIPQGPSDSFSFLRETVRTHAAATVKQGHVKPTSTYSLEKAEDRVRVIAHLSEPIPRNLIVDVPLLAQYLDTTLREGVALAYEEEVLDGDGSTAGSDDRMTGVLHESGTQSQGFDTDVFVTSRKAVTKLENLNLDPSGFAFVVSPTDWEAAELSTSDTPFVLADASGQSNNRIPIDRANRRLWGYPVVVTTGIEAGVAIFGDWSGSIELHLREQATVEWSEAPQVALDESPGTTASAFETNQRIFRCEMRAGVAIKRPSGFVVIDTSAGS